MFGKRRNELLGGSLRSILSNCVQPIAIFAITGDSAKTISDESLPIKDEPLES